MIRVISSSAVVKMGKRLFIIVMVLCFMLGPVHSYGLDALDNNEKIALANTWKIFLKAVSNDDLKMIRNLSFERIRCLSCVDNTEQEEKEIEEFEATDPDWYNKLYDEKVYIPVNKFCEEDYAIIFTKEFVKRLQDRKPAYAAEIVNKQKIYEVIIPTLQPGELSPKHEGCLHLFQFIKTKKGYKFWGIDTIP